LALFNLAGLIEIVEVIGLKKAQKKGAG